MASLLIWALPGFAHFARGDVVDMREDDDFHWGDAVLGPNCTGQMRAMVVPGVPMSTFAAFGEGDPPSDRPGDVPRQRQIRLNLDALEAMEGRKVDAYEILVRSHADVLMNTVDHPRLPNRFFIA